MYLFPKRWNLCWCMLLLQFPLHFREGKCYFLVVCIDGRLCKWTQGAISDLQQDSIHVTIQLQVHDDFKWKERKTGTWGKWKNSKWVAYGRIWTHDTPHSGQMLLPTELPRQPSWLGPNQISHTYMYTKVLLVLISLNLTGLQYWGLVQPLCWTQKLGQTLSMEKRNLVLPLYWNSKHGTTFVCI